MYRKEKPLSLKGSTSALCNNLSLQVNQEKNISTYAVVHKSVVNLVSASSDGSAINHRQIVCKEPVATHGSTIVLQAKLVEMPTRTLLVITSQKGIQMFEADGSLMLYWYGLADVNAEDVQQSTFGRGICAVGGDTVCVGTYEGHVLVFNIPSRGTNITLSEVLKAHVCAIWDLASEEDKLVSSDDSGTILVWLADERFRQVAKIRGFGSPCTSLAIWHNIIVAAYGSGHLRVFNGQTGQLAAEVTAHARWITCLDIARNNGLVLSVAEDAFARVWQLREGKSIEIEHKHSEIVQDVQLQGGRFISDDGRSWCVTGYDSNELQFFTRS